MKQLMRLVAIYMAVFGLLAVAGPLLAAQQEKVLYTFGGLDGDAPGANLILDSSGNLYGVTTYGGVSGSPMCGTYSCGTVFQLKPSADGSWTETVLHSFKGGTDGGSPVGSLVLDVHGSLYGTTANGGGTGSGCIVYGCGTVFRLSPAANGTWTETVLHNFNGSDGASPQSNLVFDAAGNLYGTTSGAGPLGGGTVFELMPTASGWKETVLHSFPNNGKDGAAPWAGVIFDAAGNLYGTTYVGGTHNFGTAFELKFSQTNSWTETVLHNFNANGDGYSPGPGSLILDQAGNLYGTTLGGGLGGGTAFRLNLGANGQWTETILYKFCSRTFCTDGGIPVGGLIFDSAGNLYGTAATGGSTTSNCRAQYGCGTVFELTPNSNGSWTETVLHAFNLDGQDGTLPETGLTRDAAGNLYGTTGSGGASGSGCGGYGCGTVFEITP